MTVPGNIIMIDQICVMTLFCLEIELSHSILLVEYRIDTF